MQLLIIKRLTVVQPPPQSGFPAPDTGQKKFNSRLVVPTRLTTTVAAEKPSTCSKKPRSGGNPAGLCEPSSSTDILS